MSAKTTLIIFSVIFSLGIIFIVILPFILGQGPVSPGSQAKDEKISAALDQGVFRSDDGGKTWEQKSWIEGRSGSISAFRVNQLVADPADAATLYLLTDGNGLWISKSRGDLWAQVEDEAGILERRANVLAIAVNPVNRQEWHVAVFQKNRGRLLVTADGGKTFREIYATPLERFGVFDVYYDRGRKTVSIVTGQGGLLETANGGKTWRIVRWFADGLIRLMVNPVNPASRLAVTPKGKIFRTSDYGQSWTDVTRALGSFSGANSNQRWFMGGSGTLYMGSKYGVLRSYDNGSTFSALELIIPPEALPVLSVAANSRDDSRLLVSAGNQLYSSSDGGWSWAILAPPSAKRATHLLFDAEKPETIYAVAQP